MLLTATNEPWAPSPSTTAVASRWAAARNPSRSPAGRSGSVTTCSRGTSSTCPLKTGRWSRNATRSGSSSTRSAGTSPATIPQKTQPGSAPPLTAGSVADAVARDRTGEGSLGGADRVEVLRVAQAVGPAQAVAAHDLHDRVRAGAPGHPRVGVALPPAVGNDALRRAVGVLPGVEVQGPP